MYFIVSSFLGMVAYETNGERGNRQQVKNTAHATDHRGFRAAAVGSKKTSSIEALHARPARTYRRPRGASRPKQKRLAERDARLKLAAT
jgi:hypothetical protein